MHSDTICKTIHQYSSSPILQENMYKLQEIAADYSRVKNYVYQRYEGIGGLSKIYPGYTVQNEMTESGLRTQLGLPSVYFYLAVFDALGDIKTQWSKVKSSMLDAVKANENFTPEDRHYLRFVVKVSRCFEDILTGREMDIPKEMLETYNNLASTVNEEKLNRYLCRKVRKNLRKLHTDKADGFAIAERAYRYGKERDTCGIYISTKEKRKRIYVPLTDENQYKRQLYIKLRPEEERIEISVPIEVGVRYHADYQSEVGLTMGMWKMFATDSGRIYGENFGDLHMELIDHIRRGSSTYHREKRNNPGRQKYKKAKARLDAKLQAYINQEINRMLETEKPRIIYIPKLPRSSKAGINRKINYSVTVWKRGLVRQRLEQKCKENAIEIIEVIGKDISTQCSECGQPGSYTKDIFHCSHCGYENDKKINAAKNALKRGQSGEQIIKTGA